MKKYLVIFLLLLCSVLTACTKKGLLIINNIEVEVDEKVKIDVVTGTKEKIEYSFEGDAIAIYDGMVRGMVAGEEVVVHARTKKHEGSFTVTVTGDNYPGYGSVEENEGWYEEISVEKVMGLDADFPMGIDVSTIQENLRHGAKYYDKNGKRVSVYKIMKDAGVNYLRLRLWNEPYQYNSKNEKLYYGGGICDFDTIKEIAVDAKNLGFKLLLNFHYSDFWADPSYQIIPKAWSEIKTASEMAEAIYDYTYQVVSELCDLGACPDMVQIGNEITSGMLTQKGGTDDGTFNAGGYAKYVSERTSAIGAVKAAYSGRGAKYDANLVSYVKAGVDAVKVVDPSILTMIQLAKGMSATDFMKTFFHTFDAINYDVIGLSYYPRWHGTISQLTNALQVLSAEFPNKKICVVETSYAYTYASNVNALNSFNAEYAIDGYEVSVQGQADFLRDVINAVAGIENGYGIFVWEGAWIPVAGVGWASSKTLNSWANQALFGYGGKMLPSLEVFSRVYSD
jgi:arabinogalactan endo-1,4-beta-galactosidase